jgi:hypothetical protein
LAAFRNSVLYPKIVARKLKDNIHSRKEITKLVTEFWKRALRVLYSNLSPSLKGYLF